MSVNSIVAITRSPDVRGGRRMICRLAGRHAVPIGGPSRPIVARATGLPNLTVQYPSATCESRGDEPYVDVGGSFNNYPRLHSKVPEGSVRVGVEGSL